jgi:hypothetical protein
MASMSTPIQELAGKQANVEPPQDPEVLSVLNEMEQEMAAAARVQHVPMVQSKPMPIPPVHMPLPSVIKQKGFYQPELLQKAGIVAALAFIIFYPETLHFVYAKFPAYQSLFMSYDVFIRAILLGVLLYVIMWKFNI